MGREFAIWLYLRSLSILLAVAALGLIVLGVYVGYSRTELARHGERINGEIIELVASADQKASPPAPEAKGAEPAPEGKGTEPAKPESCVPIAPKVRYFYPEGVERTFLSDSPSCPTSYKVGGPVVLLVDPRAPEQTPAIDSGAFWLFLPAALLSLMGAVFGLIAWMQWPSSKAFDSLLVDPALGDEEDLPLLPYVSRAAGGSGAPLAGVVATAGMIEKDKYPLELCELAAYMAALAYHEPTEKNKLTLEDYFKKNCPHFENVKTFSKEATEGFGFVFDGAAFIIMRGTAGWADWRRNLDAAKTGPRDLLPPGVGEAPPRHQGFAKGWDVIRDDVETWIKETPDKSNLPFVFAGHSLGGALSFLGAWEFAKRGRKVAAVITFGAALPGDKAFREDYDKLGLGARTVRLEFTQDIVPVAQQLIGYEAVGHEWEPKQIPLSSRKLAIAAIPVNWAVGSLQQSLFGGKADKSSENANSKQRIRKWLLRLVVFLAFSSVLALAAHKMQKRYALALSIMSYRRIRARRLALLKAEGKTALDDADLDACYKELCGHLKAVRGSPPEAPGLFDGIPSLPYRISNPLDLKWMKTFHSARSW